MNKVIKAILKTTISLVLLVAVSLTGSYVVNTYAAQRNVVDGHSMDNNFMTGRMFLQTN